MRHLPIPEAQDGRVSELNSTSDLAPETVLGSTVRIQVFRPDGFLRVGLGYEGLLNTITRKAPIAEKK